MTRTLVLFEDGTTHADGIEATAIGGPGDMPFLTEEARVATVKAALAEDDWVAAEAAASRGVVSGSDEDTVRVTFVAPPDWKRFGAALWDEATGAAHAVFMTATMLVEGVAVQGCVGRPFEDNEARSDCARWCLKNGLDDIAENVGRTPVGGKGPYCTWPEGDIEFASTDQTPSRRADASSSAPAAAEATVADRACTNEVSVGDGVNVVRLFGEVITLSDG